MTAFHIKPEMLGSAAFLKDHGARYAYVAGGMVKGIASADLVIRMSQARLLSFYGSGGQRLEVVDAAIRKIKAIIPPGAPFGVNFLHNFLMPELEQQLADLLGQHNVQDIEAAAFIEMSPALVYFRVKGLHQRSDGVIEAPHRVLGKASRAEVAKRFLAPPPAELINALRQSGKISAEEARLSKHIALASDLCAEADSGGHTDKRVAFTLLPEFVSLRDAAQQRFNYPNPVRVGAAGGLGSPQSLAAAFMLGADFVLTGSINQCTVEAGASDAVKDLLAGAGTQDMEMAPAGDMFEIGARIQVLRKGGFFAARANKLYELYRRHQSIDELAPEVRRELEEKYFRRTFEDVWEETRRYYRRAAPAEIERAEAHPKQKMAMIFRWYYIRSNRLAIAGDLADRLDYQIHCGPAMGAFNAWACGTPLENWRNRHVDEIAVQLMHAAASHFEERCLAVTGRICPPDSPDSVTHHASITPTASY
jgi:trans-AT polyketide synthase/acyltransferase/oxidoreductase domain-containing protein